MKENTTEIAQEVIGNLVKDRFWMIGLIRNVIIC